MSPRKTMRRAEIAGHARYLTFSCYHRLPLFQNDRIKQVFMDRLIAVKTERPFELLAWVIMPEHVHLIVLPTLPDHPVKHVLTALKRPVAECVLHRWTKLNAAILTQATDAKGTRHFWQPGGGYDRNLYSEHELFEKIQYVHDNPRRRGLVSRQIDYPWSSARWYAGDKAGPVSIDPIR